MNRDPQRLDPAFDPRIADWLEADPDRAPREVLDTVLAAMPSITQRRAPRVPRRLPEMLTLTRVAVAAVLGVLLVGGTLLLSQRPGQPSVGGPGPTSSPTPSAMSLEDFEGARNRLCIDANTMLAPLKERFVGKFDDSLTEAERSDWIAGLEEFSAGYETLIADLKALRPPPSLAEGHAENVAGFVAQKSYIDTVISALSSRRYAEARAADMATDPINVRMTRWENLHGFVNCP